MTDAMPQATKATSATSAISVSAAPLTDAVPPATAGDEFPEEIGGSVDLAGPDPDYCDTCGSSYDSIEWWFAEPGYDRRDGTDVVGPAGEIRLSLTVGCYGGDSLATSDLDEAATFIIDLTSRFPEHADALRSEAQDMREKVTAFHAAATDHPANHPADHLVGTAAGSATTVEVR